MKPTHTRTLSAASPVALITVGCTNSDNPQLSMCQAVAKQLTSNTISEWGSASQSDGSRSLTTKVAFTTRRDQAGSIDCVYKKQGGSGIVKTAPHKVVFNGQAVQDKLLISASSQAAKELLADTYKNTVAKSQTVVAEAGAAAGVALDAAGNVVKEVAEEVTGQVENTLQNGAVLNTDK
ncbi:MAG: hypothetical protein V3U65_18950 [Granulosicoccaceae bacterium]